MSHPGDLSGGLRGPEERAEAPLQRLKHFQLKISRGVGRNFPVMHVREHGRQKLLVGHKFHILRCDVDARQVDGRQPATSAISRSSESVG